MKKITEITKNWLEKNEKISFLYFHQLKENMRTKVKSKDQKDKEDLLEEGISFKNGLKYFKKSVDVIFKHKSVSKKKKENEVESDPEKKKVIILNSS